MDVSILQQLDAATLAKVLPGYLAAHVEDGSEDRVLGFVDHWTESDFAGLLEDLKAAGSDRRVYESNTRCRELSRAWMPDMLDTAVTGAEHLREAMDDGRTVIISNHMSYVDAVATDVALFQGGESDLADRIVYLAGPKVYQDVFRLVAAASIHSLPVPQSNSVSTLESLSVRELARQAMESLDAGKQALRDGRALLFYPEGSRSRTGRMGSFLKATRRYVQAAEKVVPASIVGSNAVMPVDSHRMHRGRVQLTFGPPIDVASGGSARDVLAQAHASVARLLPEECRPDGAAPVLV